MTVGALVAHQIGDTQYDDPVVAATMLLTALSLSHLAVGLLARDQHNTIFSRSAIPGTTQLRRYGIALAAIILVTTLGPLQRIFQTTELSGHLQAEGLVVRLEDYPIERILCSPTLRCYQTVELLARDRLLRIETVPELGVGATPAQLLALFWDLELRHSVLCTTARGSACCSRGSSPTRWWPRTRWTGPRAWPGCWSASTGSGCAAATWPRSCSTELAWR
jgi:hypothetical protein